MPKWFTGFTDILLANILGSFANAFNQFAMMQTTSLKKNILILWFLILKSNHIHRCFLRTAHNDFLKQVWLDFDEWPKPIYWEEHTKLLLYVSKTVTSKLTVHSGKMNYLEISTLEVREMTHQEATCICFNGMENNHWPR